MIARFDHRPMLTALLALTTTVLFVVVVTLATLLITLPQGASPTSGSVGGRPAAAAHKGMDAGGDNYGIYDYYSHQPKPAQIGDARGSDSSNANDAIDRHAEVVAAYNR